jgi:hypothetical protein
MKTPWRCFLHRPNVNIRCVLFIGFNFKGIAVVIAKWLYELQETESELERKREALKQVEGKLGDDKALTQARSALVEEHKRVAELEKRQRALEWEVEDMGAKVAAIEERLYSGVVRSPKELVSLHQEVERLKMRRREREDALLEIMESLDAAQRKFEAKDSEVRGLEQEWHQEQERLLKEQEQLKAELFPLEQRRGLILSRIDPASLERYQALRREKQGVAVAKMEQGRCCGCRIILPSSDLQRIKLRRELPRCSNCGRILYIE